MKNITSMWDILLHNTPYYNKVVREHCISTVFGNEENAKQILSNAHLNIELKDVGQAFNISGYVAHNILNIQEHTNDGYSADSVVADSGLTFFDFFALSFLMKTDVFCMIGTNESMAAQSPMQTPTQKMSEMLVQEMFVYKDNNWLYLFLYYASYVESALPIINVANRSLVELKSQLLSSIKNISEQQHSSIKDGIKRAQALGLFFKSEVQILFHGSLEDCVRRVDVKKEPVSPLCPKMIAQYCEAVNWSDFEKSLWLAWDTTTAQKIDFSLTCIFQLPKVDTFEAIINEFYNKSKPENLLITLLAFDYHGRQVKNAVNDFMIGKKEENLAQKTLRKVSGGVEFLFAKRQQTKKRLFLENLYDSIFLSKTNEDFSFFMCSYFDLFTEQRQSLILKNIQQVLNEPFGQFVLKDKPLSEKTQILLDREKIKNGLARINPKQNILQSEIKDRKVFIDSSQEVEAVAVEPKKTRPFKV